MESHGIGFGRWESSGNALIDGSEIRGAMLRDPLHITCRKHSCFGCSMPVPWFMLASSLLCVCFVCTMLPAPRVKVKHVHTAGKAPEALHHLTVQPHSDYTNSFLTFAYIRCSSQCAHKNTRQSTSSTPVLRTRGCDRHLWSDLARSHIPRTLHTLSCSVHTTYYPTHISAARQAAKHLVRACVGTLSPCAPGATLASPLT